MTNKKEKILTLIAAAVMTVFTVVVIIYLTGIALPLILSLSTLQRAIFQLVIFLFIAFVFIVVIVRRRKQKSQQPDLENNHVND